MVEGEPCDMFCTNASTMCFDIILTSTYSEKPGLLMVV